MTSGGEGSSLLGLAIVQFFNCFGIGLDLQAQLVQDLQQLFFLRLSRQDLGCADLAVEVHKCSPQSGGHRAQQRQRRIAEGDPLFVGSESDFGAIRRLSHG